MRIIYLLVISIIFTSTLYGQINLRPIIGNPIVEKAYLKKMADLELNPNEEEFLKRSECPIFVEDAEYLFPGDTIFFDLDTVNGFRYQLLSNTDNFGSTIFDTTLLTYAAQNITGAGRDTITVIRSIIDDSLDVELNFEIFVGRPGQTLIMQQEVLNIEERGEYCVGPIDNLPGDILCNELILPAETYGGQGLQIAFFRTGNDAENCFTYQSTRFPGHDTVGIVLCDEFAVCDTFLQPILIVGDTVSLPFFDDFTNEGPFPDESNWLEDLTFVNKTMAADPPSFGTATFDGLNQQGRPYGGGFGVADRLTSKPIDLSNSSISQNIALTFYYQMKGRGFLPRVQDSLIVEFLTDTSGWQQVAAFPGSRFIALDSFPPFTFHGVELDDPGYFHDGFQFRFSNLSERTGAFGVWHVDYVTLDVSNVASFNANDLAIVEGNGSMLNRYTSIPLIQIVDFEDKELDSSIQGIYSNLNNAPAAFNTDNNFITNLTSGNTYDVIQAGITGGNIDPFEILNDVTAIPGATFDEIAQDINIAQDEIRFEVLQTISGSDNLNIRTNNDTIRTETIISDYFAYDDGTAERALDSDGVNSVVVLEYEANQFDSLHAVQFHFPEVNGDFFSQQFNLMVWIGGDQPGTLNEAYRLISQPVSTDSLQGFSTYLIRNELGEPEPLIIPPGKFYVGWQQLASTSNPIPVGFDRNNRDASQFVWFFTGADWRRLDDFINFQGALMVRPVMGRRTLVSTDLVTAKNQEINVYPNPVENLLNFQLEKGNYEDYQINIFNNLGQSFYNGKMTQQIDTQRFTAGIYFAKVVNQKTGEAQFVQFVKQ